jgi:hypothetical protein
MDQQAEILAKLFWMTYEPIVRAIGHIEGDAMAWEELVPGTREALIKTFYVLLSQDVVRAGKTALTSQTRS